MRRLGPGLLFAGAAVGVSHLVQSTRAGAEFGLTLAGLIVFVCLIKYPAFRFGAEYAAVTGESVIAGYERQGRWLLLLFLVATVIEGVGVIPAVSLVTAGLAMNLFGFEANEIVVTMAIVLGASEMLALGRYRVLETITRVFVVLFSVLCVVTAVAAATTLGGGHPVSAPFELTEANLFFAVAVAGWMPVGLGGSVFLSVWVVARAKTERRPVNPDEARFDFNVGYFTTVVIALCFLVMGTALLFGSQTRLAEGSAGFAAQLVGLFSGSIGGWARIAAAVAAFAVMLSSVVTVVDGFPRVYADVVSRLWAKFARAWGEERLYLAGLTAQIAAALTLMTLFLRSFEGFIDVVTTVGFVTAPVVAFLNHRVMFSSDVGAAERPGSALRYWSLAGIAILAIVFPTYLYFRFG